MKRTFPSLHALQDAIVAGELSGPLHVTVLHDVGCPAPGAPCVCKPQYGAERLTFESYQRGARAQREWRAAQRRRGQA